ncbi:MAG: FGGY family carbohydrate kinase [Acidobacteriota bacterium]|nr:FGGY family carbohydrate kinase [Acidobacteriota bacterium]
MSCVLGIDVGSSSAKVGLFALDGRVISITSRSYPTFEPRPGFKEQDPELWWKAVVEGIRTIISNVPQEEILALGASGHISSLTFVDKSGKALRPAISFQDQRAVVELDELNSRFSREDLAGCLGIDLPPAPTWPMPRLLWFKRHEPSTLQDSYCFLQAKDFMNLRLTGEFASDVSSNKGLTDFATNQFAEGLLSAFDLPSHLFPRLYRPEEIIGEVSKQAASQTGLPAGLPVVTGWNDLNACALGSGVFQEGDAFNLTGTSEHIGVVTGSRHQSPGLICAPFLAGRNLFYGVTCAGGGSLAWFAKAFGHEIDQLLALADGIPLGSDLLYFLPYIEGERSPIWDPSAQGTFCGIRSCHAAGHFVRAILEGVAYGLWQIFELVERSAETINDPLVISGGAARIRLWNQIKADLVARTVAVPANPDVGVLGAAMLAAVATGHYESCEAASRGMARVEERFFPAPERTAQYRKLYSLYCQLYPTLRTWFEQIDEQRHKLRRLP